MRLKAIAFVAVLPMTIGCRRSPPPPATEIVADTAPQSFTAPGAHDPNGPADDDAREQLPTEIAPSTVQVPAQVVVPGLTDAAAKPVDPFEAAMADTRAGAVPCFASLAAAEYAATLVMTVTPSGRVTRAEVERGNVDDDSVIACLKTFSEGRFFPASKDGRTVRVEVRVRSK